MKYSEQSATVGSSLRQEMPHPVVHSLTGKELGAWDNFVRRHPFGSVYHLTNWKRVLEGAFSHIRGHVLAVRSDETGELLAGFPIYEVRSWLLGTRLVAAPFASLYDPLASRPNEVRALVSRAENLAREVGARAVELKSVKGGSLLNDLGWNRSSHHIHSYLEIEENHEKVKSKFSKTAVLQMIARAEKGGIRIKRSRDKADLKALYEILVVTRRKNGLPPLPYALFSSMIEHLDPDHLQIFLGYDRDEVCGAMLTLRFNDMFTIEYSGNAHGAQKTGVNQLLYWEGIKYACAIGCSKVSFGRTSALNQGLITYKRRWGTKEEPITVLHYPPLASVKNAPVEESTAYKAIRTFSGNAPRIFVNLLGRFVYRHLG